MPSGSGGQIAIAPVGSLYFALSSGGNAAWAWTNFVSETIEHTLDELEEGSITGYKDAPPSHKGLDMSKGDINLEPNPDALGNYLKGVFGQSSSSVLTAAGSTGANSGAYGAGAGTNFHRFVPIQAAVAPQNFLPPYAFMIYKDLGSAWFHQGAQIHALELQVQAGQLAKAKISMMARDVTRFAVASIPAPPKSRPWIWDMASVQVGPGVTSLAANTNFESITLNLNTPLEGVVLLDGTKKYAEFQVNEFRRVAISGTISFRNQDEYDSFVAYENRFLRLTLRNTNSATLLGNPASAFYPTLEVDVPQFKILSYSVPISGPNRLQVSFTGKGERDISSAYMIEAKLTNATASY